MRGAPKDFSPKERAKVMAAVRQGAEAGRSVGFTARAWGITAATYYRWVRDEARGNAAGPMPQGTAPVQLVDRPGSPGGRQTASALAKPRRRGPLPLAERMDLQERAGVLSERGIPPEVIAERLGVTERTVVRWLASAGPEVGFIEVEVVADRAPAPVSPVLHVPGGYRVEGLDVAGLADLLRRLA